MAAIDDVNAQFVNPADKIAMYDGATPDDFGQGSWKAWDIRGWLNRLTWDLLRFQDWTAFSKRQPNPKSNRWGLRDSVSRQHNLAEQNNELLKQIAAKLDVEPGG